MLFKFSWTHFFSIFFFPPHPAVPIPPACPLIPPFLLCLAPSTGCCWNYWSFCLTSSRQWPRLIVWCWPTCSRLRCSTRLGPMKRASNSTSRPTSLPRSRQCYRSDEPHRPRPLMNSIVWIVSSLKIIDLLLFHTRTIQIESIHSKPSPLLYMVSLGLFQCQLFNHCHFIATSYYKALMMDAVICFFLPCWYTPRILIFLLSHEDLFILSLFSTQYISFETLI